MAGTREEPSDPRIYLRQIWRFRWVLIAVAVGIPVLVYLASTLLPKTYEATATLQAPNQEQMDRAIQLLETRSVANQAARRLDVGNGAADALDATIVAAPTDPQTGAIRVPGPQLFTVAAQEDTAREAAEVANAFAQVKQLRGVESDDIDAVVLERAVPPEAPIAPEPLRNTAVALVFSLLLAGGLAVLLTAFDRRLRGPAQLEAILGAPLLATIPERAFADSALADGASEPFQMLRTNLTYLNPDRTLSSVVVASPGEADGSTTVAVNLAIASAEADQDVLLVDCDLRKSSIATQLGIVARHGLEDVLIGGRDLESALAEVDVDTEGGRLRVLPAGAPPANPAALLSSSRMSSFLESAAREVDLVVVDTPPLLAVSDAIPLLPQASGVLMVARLDRTDRDALSRAQELTVGTGATLLGGVLTAVGEGRLEREGYGYGYGATDSHDAEERAPQPGRLRRAYGRVRGGPRTEDGR